MTRTQKLIYPSLVVLLIVIAVLATVFSGSNQPLPKIEIGKTTPTPTPLATQPPTGPTVTGQPTQNCSNSYQFPQIGISLCLPGFSVSQLAPANDTLLGSLTAHSQKDSSGLALLVSRASHTTAREGVLPLRTEELKTATGEKVYYVVLQPDYDPNQKTVNAYFVNSPLYYELQFSYNHSAHPQTEEVFRNIVSSIQLSPLTLQN